jgi:ABC-type transporter Mla subunit MlaD
MAETLRQALEDARPQLEAGLAEAEAELAQLEQRRGELLALIAQAKVALGQARTPAAGIEAGQQRGLTLHAALSQVLREHDNEWMTVRELANEVNARGLYAKRDGSPVEANQVHARTKNYAELFEKDGARVRLRRPD